VSKLIIFCDGGFGNRFGSLISGLVIAKHFNLKPVVHWVNTRVCRLPLSEIFDGFEEISDYDIADCIAVGHIANRNYIWIDNYNSLDELPFERGKTNWYCHHWIPDWMPEELVIEQVKRLKFNKFVFACAEMFCRDNNIDNNTIGLHLRGTDSPLQSQKVEQYHMKIDSSPNIKFLIVSDEEKNELDFTRHSNVITRPKTSYVELHDPTKGWYENCERTSNSVREAIVDLLILSRTSIVRTNINSSFLKTAIYLQVANENS